MPPTVRAPITAQPPTPTQGPAAELFATREDAALFEDIRTGRIIGGPPRMIRPLALDGRPFWIRPGTTDAGVLIETLSRCPHVPPAVLPAAPVILDLGAHIGATTAHLAERHPGASIVAVELEDQNAQLCARNVEELTRSVRVESGAAWSEDGVVSYGGKGRAAYRVRCIWDLFHENAEPELGRVPAIGMANLVDRTLRRLSPPRGRIDYIKMDIEGSEAAIFEHHDLTWLSRVASIRVYVHEPTSVDRIIHQLHYKGGLIASACPRFPQCVIAVSREMAGAQPRFPQNAERLRPPPPPI